MSLRDAAGARAVPHVLLWRIAPLRDSLVFVYPPATIIRAVAAILLVTCALAALASGPVPVPSLSVQPQLLVNGSVCLFKVDVKGSPERVSAKWLDRDLTFTH